jgi:nitric oxide reductase NorE protein
MKEDVVGTTHRPEAGVPSILVFIAADIFSFILFFAVFMGERLAQPDLFARSSSLLDARLGLANTLILITSGWLVALATAATRRGDLAAARRFLWLAIGVGLGFAALKLIEYCGKFAEGITPLTNAFFGAYFIFTGVHFLHYVVGMALLVALAVMARRPLEAGLHRWIEGCALYWHMVDLLWIFLFPMLYLQAAR